MLFIFIALSLSVAFQIIASVLAVSLIKKTRYNVAWILLSIAFACIAMQRIYDLYYLSQLDGKFDPEISFLSNWFSVLISFLIFVGTIYIKKLFNYMEKMETLVRENESKIFSAIDSPSMIISDLPAGTDTFFSAVSFKASDITRIYPSYGCKVEISTFTVNVFRHGYTLIADTKTCSSTRIRKHPRIPFQLVCVSSVAADEYTISLRGHPG